MQNKYDLKKQYRGWTWDMRSKEERYIKIYTKFFQEDYLKRIDGNSMKLYLYLTYHAHYETGESFHSVKTIAEYFGKSERTIHNWINNLESNDLIERVTGGYNSVTKTFIVPY